jgi:hypothetical protein
MKTLKAAIRCLLLIAAVLAWSGCVTETTVDEPPSPPPWRPVHHSWWDVSHWFSSDSQPS